MLPNTFQLFTLTEITLYGTQRGTDYAVGSVRTIGHCSCSLRALKVHKSITHLQPASIWGFLVGELSSGCVILCISTRRGTISRLSKQATSTNGCWVPSLPKAFHMCLQVWVSRIAACCPFRDGSCIVDIASG